LPGGTVALAIDDLKYDYLGNRLTKVTDSQQNASGYPYIVTPYEITYDGNGNMIRHRDKGLESIEYNYLNLPRTINGAPGKNRKYYNYAYRADGAKISKSYLRGAETWSTDYLDGFQYSFYTGPTPPLTTSDLKFVPTSEGYYDFENNAYIYHYTDHLGNVRLSYTDTNKDGIIQPRQYHVQQCDGPWDPWNPPNCIDYWKPGEIVETNTYYPFGLLHNYTTTTQNAYQYKYNGKELQETGMYDYGARFYMPDIGRWGVIDNKAEKYPSMSSYTYAGNNPIAFIDPDGNELILSFATDTARKSYEDLVNASLGGKYSATYSKIEGTDTYKVTLNMVNKDAPITKEQQAFYDTFNSVVGAKEIVNNNILENSELTVIGRFQTGDIDIADILEFDKAGKGGTSSAGALAHEHAEQLEKSKMGIPQGKMGETKTDEEGNKTYPQFEKAHAKGFKAEDKVNGNKRVEPENSTMNIDVFQENNKTKTSQAFWPTESGGLNVKKTTIH
jgi:RHS repeat-associated protein